MSGEHRSREVCVPAQTHTLCMDASESHTWLDHGVMIHVTTCSIYITWLQFWRFWLFATLCHTSLKPSRDYYTPCTTKFKSKEKKNDSGGRALLLWFLDLKSFTRTCRSQIGILKKSFFFYFSFILVWHQQECEVILPLLAVESKCTQTFRWNTRRWRRGSRGKNSRLLQRIPRKKFLFWMD